MQAVEFKSKPHDNVVDLPPNLRDWNNRPVRVILLADEEGALPAIGNAFKAISLKTHNFRFDRDEANAR
jgi:hypothetical protein